MFGCERGNWPTHPQQAYKDNISKKKYEEELKAMEEHQAQNMEQEEQEEQQEQEEQELMLR